MKIHSTYDDDQIQFSGIGTASTIQEYAEPRKKKRRAFKVRFAAPKVKGTKT